MTKNEDPKALAFKRGVAEALQKRTTTWTDLLDTEETQWYFGQGYILARAKLSEAKNRIRKNLVALYGRGGVRAPEAK